MLSCSWNPDGFFFKLFKWSNTEVGVVTSSNIGHVFQIFVFVDSWMFSLATFWRSIFFYNCQDPSSQKTGPQAGTSWSNVQHYWKWAQKLDKTSNTEKAGDGDSESHTKRLQLRLSNTSHQYFAPWKCFQGIFISPWVHYSEPFSFHKEIRSKKLIGTKRSRGQIRCRTVDIFFSLIYTQSSWLFHRCWNGSAILKINNWVCFE